MLKNITLPTVPLEISDEKVRENLETLLAAFKSSYPQGVMALLRSFPGEEVWRLFVDGAHQRLGQTWKDYESREDGYLVAMSSAFVYLIDYVKAGKSFDLHLIKTMHHLALAGVKQTHYPFWDRFMPYDKYEFDNTLDSGVYLWREVNTNERGLSETFHRIQRGNPLINIFYIDKEESIFESGDFFGKIRDFAKKIYKENVWGRLCVYLTEGLFAINFETLGKDVDCNMLAQEKFRQVVSSNPLATFRASGFKKCADSFFSHLIDSFNAQMQDTNLPYKKLGLIIEFVAECEQSHPYIDGNGRTFCTLLLNYLLIANNFPPTIMDDPNRFDGFDVKTLMHDVIEGMANALKVSKGERVYYPDDVLSTYINTEAFEQSCDILAKHFVFPLTLSTERESISTATAANGNKYDLFPFWKNPVSVRDAAESLIEFKFC